MNIWLIANEFLRQNDKFRSIERWFAESAERYSLGLTVKTNADILCQWGIPSPRDATPSIQGASSSLPDAVLSLPDAVLFWDKDVKLAQYLEDLQIPVHNPSAAIAICDDKALTHRTLHRCGIPTPKTIAAPMTYRGTGYTNANFITAVEEILTYPLILKECQGSFGEQVYKMENRRQLTAKLNQLAGKPLLFQEWIANSAGRDVRLQVVRGRVVAAMYRHSDEGDFRANITNGGKMEPYQPNATQCNLAIRSCEAVGLDFAGVDLLFGEGDEPLVCEVNSNAHFQNIYECTGVNVADAIMEALFRRTN